MDEKNVEESEPKPTDAKPGNIQAINKNTIHKICSGQVVVTLAVAVKELVENAVDAGATLVEIKLHEQGLQSVEVSDNGTGVSAKDLEVMTAKYHTSKLNKFVDLLSVETFGFRGEALSSLCALSKMSIVTRHKDSDVAIKIELDHSGKISKRSPCSRSIGTTVTLSNLFETLPVRRRDFTRNIKREFTKTINMMQAYCLVAKGVRVICSNHTAKSGKTVVLQTHGAKETLANISAVFGVRQCNELLPLKPAFSDINTLTKEIFLEELSMIDSKADTLHITNEDFECIKAGQFQFEGFISSCSHGAGRSSRDRQFFYINSRPCDSKNLSKVVNEIYHRYNANQEPFVYLNVITKRADVDINVTPDKRLLLLKHEKILLMLLKKSLCNTFGNIPAQHKIENISIASIFKVEPKNEISIIADESQVIDDNLHKTEISKAGDEAKQNEDTLNKTEDFTDTDKSTKNEENQTEEDTLIPISTAENFMNVLSQWRRTGDTTGSAHPIRVTGTKRKCMNELEARTLKMQKIQDYLTQEISKTKEESHFASYKSESDSENEETNTTVEPASPNKSFPCIEKINEASKEYDLITSTSIVQRIDCKVSGPAKSFLTFVKEKPSKYDSKEVSLPNTQKSISSKISYDFDLPSTSAAARAIPERRLPSADITTCSDSEDDLNTLQIPEKLKLAPKLLSTEETINSESDDDQQNSKISSAKTIILDEANKESDPEVEKLASVVWEITLEEIAAGLEAEEKYLENERSSINLQRLRFKSEIKPSENKNAEKELKTEISKSDFCRMDIIGQFNLGFIVVKLDDDLFIVDQHASDEKYNFEKLQETTVISSQRLVVPQRLELTVVNEMILMDNLSVFEKNGFKFEIDENATPGRKVRLVAKPISKNWEFGKEDIDELIFMLQDAPKGTTCRPSRVRSMFASRACRKSVMIGTKMDEPSMKNLITHMGEIEQPWNCPHGRPTIRHLINVAMIDDSSDESDDSSDNKTAEADNDNT